MTEAGGYQFKVALHDTDAAGVLFFSHLFRHAHDAYEAFMDEIGCPLEELLVRRDYLLPLVHAEADYLQPIRHGNLVSVRLSLLRIGRSSFSLGYEFIGRDGQTLAKAATAHVAINADNHSKIPLPAALRSALSAQSAASE